MLAGLTDSSPHGRVSAHKRPLLRVAQELKDRLRFSQLYGESHQEAGFFQHPQAALERSSPVAQELQDRLTFSKLYSSSHPLPSSNGKVFTTQALQQAFDEHGMHSFSLEQGVAETEDLQQQLAQARMVISHLASQVDHHRNVQNQLTGHLNASHTEATELQCTARLYHQAMDECQRLQSENIALRQMLQNALDTGPTPRARSSSRGQQGRSANCARARSCSPLSSFIRTGGGYAPLEYDTALSATSAPEDAADEAGAAQLPSGHRHTAAVKPGSWVPSQVVEVVTRFARRLNKEVAWGDIQQLLVLINQMYGRQEEERTQELQQQHAKCAHTLRRQAANAEPYTQVRDRQVIAHLKAQLAQAQANKKQPSRVVGRKAQAHVHRAMEKCLHMDRQLEMLASENHTLKRNMGVYIAEAQRAKTTLQHSLQSRVAMASHAGRTQYESAYDSPQPSQTSQHESSFDLPHSSQMNQHRSTRASYGRPGQHQSPESEQAETDAQENQHHHSTDQFCSPLTENQQGLLGVPCIKEGSQQGQSRSTPQLAFQLQEANNHSSCTDAKPHTDSMEAKQHGHCKQTPAEFHPAPEADYRLITGLDSQSHLQLNGQPASPVQQALSQAFEACSDCHMAGSKWEDSRQEDDGNNAGGGNFRGVASPNAARFAFARPVTSGGQHMQEKEM
ncbi:hypothetical protein WJX79_005655 [Trebouxia sp. C0005]